MFVYFFGIAIDYYENVDFIMKFSLVYGKAKNLYGFARFKSTVKVLTNEFVFPVFSRSTQDLESGADASCSQNLKKSKDLVQKRFITSTKL